MRGFDLAPELTPDCHNTPQNSEHTSGAMERYTWVRFAAKLTPCHRTHIAKVSIPVGRWMKVQGKGRRQAHVRSRVVMDIAAFKISHSVGIDKDTTALRAKKWSA